MDKFYTFIWPERAHVLRMALLLTHDQAEAEDLTQETIIKAWQALDSFAADNCGARPWLSAILRHCWIDRYRANKSDSTMRSLDSAPEPTALPETPDDSSPAALDATTFQQMLEGFSDQGLINLIKQMPTDYRWAVMLVDVHAYSYEDAANILEVPIGTVRSRLFRGRDFLRNRLASEKK